ncbi:hypothetical protein EVAR_17223_1 [Eumeta japonica]|uniref:Uncharacterized protein n=1 Tax=Eumeta variegata TaxID=151549 RepID=A0A4C1U970_EUMVA|nr:hypothetical protein EVAR_17223_1 [Eumeta japonica]
MLPRVREKTDLDRQTDRQMVNEYILSCGVLSCGVLPVVSCPVVSCPVVSCPVVSCPVVSCPVVSCPVVSCPVLWSNSETNNERVCYTYRPSVRGPAKPGKADPIVTRVRQLTRHIRHRIDLANCAGGGGGARHESIKLTSGKHLPRDPSNAIPR